MTPGLSNEPHIRDPINGADSADTKAAKAAISEEDIKRWSAIAGVTPALPKEPEPMPSAPKEEKSKAFPLLPPPPSSSRSSGSRFNFFSRNKSGTSLQDEDSDSDGDDMGTGYAKLGAPVSDDDDDGYESEKPFTRRPVREAEKKDEPPADEPLEAGPALSPVSQPISSATGEGSISPATGESSSSAELRSALREVLERVQSLVRDSLTQLTQTESHKELAASHSSLLTTLKISRSNLVMAEANTEMLEEELRRAKAAARANMPRPAGIDTAGRVSGEHLPARSPSTAAFPGKESKGWFGIKKPAGSLPSPSGSESGGLRVSTDVQRTSTPAPEDEVVRLRSQLDTQAAELETLKTGKKEIEAELEGLSQALFEEANKMVADERRKRAEVEETLKEINGECEVLKETIKVLGGRPEEPPTPSAESEAESEVPGEQTPNLDRHYAALRRSIHHVVDGPTPDPSVPASPDEAPKFGSPGFESEPNPWANNGSPVVV